MVREIDMKKRWRKIAAVLGAVIFCLAAGILLWGREDDEAKAAAVLQEEEVPSTKQAVLDLERGNDAMVPVGNREKMTRLTILRDGEAVFEIEKRPSENQEDFMEWYVTEPYKSPQLVNVSDLYEFLDHYASWDCIGSGNEEGFQESGIIVEEEFSDTGTVRIHLGKKEENTAQTILIEAGDSRKVYEVEEKTLQAMMGLNPEDFIMGIANLVYLTTVESLQIETRKVSALIEIETDENNGQVYRAAGNELDGDDFRDLYAEILSVLIEGSAEKREEGEEAVLSFVFQRNTAGLEDVTVRYFPYDQKHYLIEKNGTAEFLADREQVDGLIEKLERYCGKL